MHKFRNLLLAFIASITLFSCSNDDFNTQDEKPIKNDNFTFIYNNVKYSSPYHYDKDSTIILDDKETNELYTKLQNLPELASYIKDINIIEYFDNSEIALTTLEKRPIFRTSLPFTSFKLTLFSDRGYKGRTSIIESRVDESNSSYQYMLTDLGYRDFDNILSSFHVLLYTNGRLPTSGRSYPKGAFKLFLHENTLSNGGKTLIFDYQGKSSDIRCIDLRTYKWDNKVSALRVLCW
jgi:hypothetical protein